MQLLLCLRSMPALCLLLLLLLHLFTFPCSKHPLMRTCGPHVTSASVPSTLSVRPAEFEALKERIEGKRTGFGNVSCVVATIFVSDVPHFQDDQFSSCKIDGTRDGELRDQLVVGSLDLNQTAKLPDEICGAHPKGIEAHRNRGYLSNVCVAKELQRRGIGSTLIKHTKKLAQLRGISDLYTHVVAENESAKKLYEKNGFVVESEEKASEARLSGRPRRLLLWVHLEKPL